MGGERIKPISLFYPNNNQFAVVSEVSFARIPFGIVPISNSIISLMCVPCLYA